MDGFCRSGTTLRAWSQRPGQCSCDWFGRLDFVARYQTNTVVLNVTRRLIILLHVVLLMAEGISVPDDLFHDTADIC